MTRRPTIQTLAFTNSSRHKQPASPDAVAVVDDDRQLTYAELNARANQLAHRLHRAGSGPRGVGGDLPGALRRRGRRAAGDPQGRRRLCAARPELSRGARGVHADRYAGPGAGHAARHCSRSCRRLAGTCCAWTGTRRAIAAQPDTDPPCAATAESLAYVIYTSGSTGTPKGIASAARHTW